MKRNALQKGTCGSLFGNIWYWNIAQSASTTVVQDAVLAESLLVDELFFPRTLDVHPEKHGCILWLSDQCEALVQQVRSSARVLECGFGSSPAAVRYWSLQDKFGIFDIWLKCAISARIFALQHLWSQMLLCAEPWSAFRPAWLLTQERLTRMLEWTGFYLLRIFEKHGVLQMPNPNSCQMFWMESCFLPCTCSMHVWIYQRCCL